MICYREVGIIPKNDSFLNSATPYINAGKDKFDRSHYEETIKEKNEMIFDMKNKKLTDILISAMLLGAGLALPFLTGQIEHIGNMLLPMHLPVMLCGLICGPQYGTVIGFVLPVMRSLLFGMPALYPNAVGMCFELAAYGFLAGFLFRRARWQCIKSLYRCLIAAMLGGRIVWGIAQCFLLGIGAGGFGLSAFFAGAFFNAVPGIILQLILIPAIMLALDKTHLVPMKKGKQHKCEKA